MADCKINTIDNVKIEVDTMCDEKVPTIEVYEDPFYSKSNQDQIAKAVAQVEKGKVIRKSLENLENLTVSD